MTDQDKAFIATHKAWLESIRLNRIEIENAIAYDKARIELTNKQISLNIDQIDLIDDYRDAGIISFDNWCKENGVDPAAV